jgi:hypothetical protein
MCFHKKFTKKLFYILSSFFNIQKASLAMTNMHFIENCYTNLHDNCFENQV